MFPFKRSGEAAPSPTPTRRSLCDGYGRYASPRFRPLREARGVGGAASPRRRLPAPFVSSPRSHVGVLREPLGGAATAMESLCVARSFRVSAWLASCGRCRRLLLRLAVVTSSGAAADATGSDAGGSASLAASSPCGDIFPLARALPSLLPGRGGG